MLDAVQTPAEPGGAVGTSDDPFAASVVEGPFGYKPDRNRPIEPHFDGFGRLTPEQARQVLDVRDGRRGQCVIELATETVLVEHAGQGYCDPATGRQWGYRVRRLVREPGPSEEMPAIAHSPMLHSPAVADVETPVVAVEVPAAQGPVDPAPQPELKWAVKPEAAPSTAAEDHADDAQVPDEEWAAPARSVRAIVLADPAERTALVRVLVIWFVVVLLLAECATLIAGGR